MTWRTSSEFLEAEHRYLLQQEVLAESTKENHMSTSQGTTKTFHGKPAKLHNIAKAPSMFSIGERVRFPQHNMSINVLRKAVSHVR
jgi:hypothetical protein